MRKTLITGAHGFLGHHVVAKFVAENEKIFTPTSKEMNLANPTSIRQALWEYQPDTIIHLAAQCGGIGINSAKPGEFLYNNMMMTAHLIDACRAINKSKILPEITKFVGIGTVCSYPKNTPVPFKEEDLYNGYPEETNAPYGLAKRMQLEMLRAYHTQYGLNGIFLIPVNMVGEFDNFNDDSSHVIPAMIKKFHNAKVNNEPQVILWGDGSASREFLYAGDCAEAIYQATMSYNKPDPINIGTGHEIQIRNLAYKIKEIVKYKGSIVWDITKPNGQPRRCLDVEKAKLEFGFQAETSLDVALIKTYNWAQGAKVL
jgi:GDP-L-fucose synthase